MTIEEALAMLTKIRDKYGNIEVFFDCPKCGISYTPGIAVTVANHFKSAEAFKK